MPPTIVEIVVQSEDFAAADWLALDLVDFVRISVEESEVHRERSDPSTQDLGATVILVLGTPVALKVADKLVDAFVSWLGRRQQAELSIRLKDESGVERTVSVKGSLDARSIERLIRDLFAK